MKKNVEKSVESRTSANSASWGGDREFDDDDDAANSASWGGDREFDYDDGGEQCELGWR